MLVRAIGILSILLSSPLFAEEPSRPPRVFLRAPPSGELPLNLDALRALLRIELSSDLRAAREDSGLPAEAEFNLILELEARPGDELLLRIERRDAAPLSRLLPLQDVAMAARARAVALAIGELARTGAPPDAPPPPAETTLETEAEPPGLGLAAAFGARKFSAPGPLLWDARVALRHSLSGRVVSFVSVEGGVLTSTTHDALGTVTLRAPLAALAAGFAGEGPWGFELELAPRLELAWVFVRGAPADPSVSGGASRAWALNAALSIAVSRPLLGPVSLSLSAMVGHSILGVDAHADERSVATLEGFMGGLALGLCWR